MTSLRKRKKNSLNTGIKKLEIGKTTQTSNHYFTADNKIQHVIVAKMTFISPVTLKLSSLLAKTLTSSSQKIIQSKKRNIMRVKCLKLLKAPNRRALWQPVKIESLLLKKVTLEKRRLMHLLWLSTCQIWTKLLLSPEAQMYWRTTPQIMPFTINATRRKHIWNNQLANVLAQAHRQLESKLSSSSNRNRPNANQKRTTCLPANPRTAWLSMDKIPNSTTKTLFESRSSALKSLGSITKNATRHGSLPWPHKNNNK